MICGARFKNHFVFCLCHLGKPGKSGHVIMYLVKNLFKNQTPKNIKGIMYYNHPQGYRRSIF